MICKTCKTPHGAVDMATSDKKPPTWVCGNGHRQPWEEDVRPAWIEAAGREIIQAQDDVGELDEFMVCATIERHWRGA